MPLQATSGAASYDGFGGGVAVVPTYIEDVFSTYLYTGTGAAQTITNGIDLSTKGGLVWTACRSSALGQIRQTSIGTYLTQGPPGNVTDSSGNFISAFNSTGFTIGNGTAINNSGSTFVSWTFRKQPKFFDVVTYTGTGSSQTIAHNLGSVPGCIIVKANDYRNWGVYHRSLGVNDAIYLDATNAATGGDFWSSTNPTSTNFTVGTPAITNSNGVTYVAYLFAHDAGGFGLTGTDNVISCGSYTTDGSSNATVNLGYEPQWVLTKSAGFGNPSFDFWSIVDNMRGMPVTTASSPPALYPNSSAAESDRGNYLFPTATGFNVNEARSGATYIYIAIRRGPMKVPTLGTSVFNTVLWTGNSTNNRQITGVGFSPDYVEAGTRSATTTFSRGVVDRLRGTNPFLVTYETGGENANSDLVSFDNDGITVDYVSSGIFNNSSNIYGHFFKRAPGFFDEVCYTGTGSALNPTHSLGVTPELKIIKSRSGSVAWIVGGSVIGGGVNFYMFLETNAIVESTNYWSSGSDSATTFSTRAGNSTSNSSGQTYVAYLFATCAGVSKVFSYTGNGSSQTINCGFTGGARFVLIKRTDSTGDWYVWDSARGIVAGNDPHLSLNTTAAEVTTDDSVDTDNTGFIVNQVAATNVNVSSATYIGLAIA